MKRFFFIVEQSKDKAHRKIELEIEAWDIKGAFSCLHEALPRYGRDWFTYSIYCGEGCR